ncbi:MAG: hypothetical protein FJW39_17560 [Acidobacteria bacterium]|nr:hypothetical protein [Acidobacteriota bacterium]
MKSLNARNAPSLPVIVGVYRNACAMVNYDPKSGRPTPEVLKAIARERGNKAGVYATVIRCGRLSAGQPIFFESSGSSS